jgi:hypothetical protein
VGAKAAVITTNPFIEGLKEQVIEKEFPAFKFRFLQPEIASRLALKVTFPATEEEKVSVLAVR